MNYIHMKNYKYCIKFVVSALCLLVSATIFAQPVISSFTPQSGAVGTSVTINGTGFSTTTSGDIVSFGATKAIVTAATATMLTVTVPAGASYQPITVLNTANNLSACTAQPFNITFNNGNGQTISTSSFSSSVNFTTGTTPFSIVAVSDIDGDGKPDLIITNEYSNTFSVLRNTSTPGSITTASFAAKVDFATDSTPSFIAVGDIDGDGKPDIVLANQFTNRISIFRNTASSGSITSASFAAKVDFISDTLSLPSSIAIGDIDGDGKPDIAVSNLYSNTISVLRNTATTGSISSASFAAPVDFVAGLGPTCVSIVDVNGDGKPDMVVANYNSKTVSVLQNINTIAGSITTASFAAPINLATNTGPYSFAVADVNNDTKPDIIVANQGSNNISVLVNNSTSSNIAFATKTDFSSGGNSPFSVAAGNLNGDSLPDIVVSNATTNTLSVLQNTYASGTAASFGNNVNFTTGFFPFTAIASDLDGDGEADIAVPNDGSNNISILRNALPNSIVPVSLLSFTGRLNTGNALLNWQTTMEENASYFNIQRSKDGINFTTIGKEDATGNSSMLDSYNYTDMNVALLGINKIYYRLQEVDNDGTNTYSNIVPIDLIDNGNTISLYPNPANNSITLEYPAIANNAQILITTIDGKSILRQTVAAGSGKTTIDISGLSKGSYILVFNNGESNAVMEFVKL